MTLWTKGGSLPDFLITMMTSPPVPHRVIASVGLTVQQLRSFPLNRQSGGAILAPRPWQIKPAKVSSSVPRQEAAPVRLSY